MFDPDGTERGSQGSQWIAPIVAEALRECAGLERQRELHAEVERVAVRLEAFERQAREAILAARACLSGVPAREDG